MRVLGLILLTSLFLVIGCVQETTQTQVSEELGVVIEEVTFNEIASYNEWVTGLETDFPKLKEELSKECETLTSIKCEALVNARQDAFFSKYGGNVRWVVTVSDVSPGVDGDVYIHLRFDDGKMYKLLSPDPEKAAYLNKGDIIKIDMLTKFSCFMSTGVCAYYDFEVLSFKKI